MNTPPAHTTHSASNMGSLFHFFFQFQLPLITCPHITFHEWTQPVKWSHLTDWGLHERWFPPQVVLWTCSTSLPGFFFFFQAFLVLNMLLVDTHTHTLYRPVQPGCFFTFKIAALLVYSLGQSVNTACEVRWWNTLMFSSTQRFYHTVKFSAVRSESKLLSSPGA